MDKQQPELVKILIGAMSVPLEMIRAALEGTPYTIAPRRDQSIPAIPPEIRDAATAVGRWFDEKGYRDWTLGPCADIEMVKRLAIRVRELEENHK